MPEITSAQRYEALTDAIDLVGQLRERHFSRRNDYLPYGFLMRVQVHIEVQRRNEFAAISDPPKKHHWWAFWKKDLNA